MEAAAIEPIMVDSFAGGGGASTGIALAVGREVDYAVNHCADALAMHAANHPGTEHMEHDVWNVAPDELAAGRPVDLCWFSPDCKHFSKAKGSRPVNKRVRALAWNVIKWAKAVHPRRIFLENVEEFQDWGPVSADGVPIKARRGETFRRWVRQLRAQGYAVEWRILNACDFGVPTTRRRLYLVARCDGEPIEFPEPTHGPGLLPYRTAAECIDWSIPGRSIFGRKKPLVESTMFRIARGLQRYVIEAGDDAYIIRTGHYSNRTGAGRTLRGQRLSDPLGTVCAGANDKNLIVPWITRYYGGGPNGKQVAGSDVMLPLPAITTIDHNWLAAAELEVAERVDPERVQEVRAFLIKYYKNGTGQKVTEPLHTITCNDRFGIVEVHGREYQIVDITQRMLEPHELAAAQGFPEDYVLTGTKKNKIARIGNSVCPPMAELMVRCNP